jgi:PKD repeat protein
MSRRVLAVLGFAALFGPAQPAVAGTVTGVSLSTRTIVVGTSVSVTVTGTNPCGAAHIIYGDGAAITYPITGLPTTQTHIYDAPGNYTITARGMGNCDGEATTTLTVMRTAPAAPAATISDVQITPRPAKVREPVAVIVRGSGLCLYEVNYGDGDSRQVNGHLPQDTHHAYQKPGTYTVIVKPEAPCAGKFTQLLQITDASAPPTPRVTHVVLSPSRGIVGESIAVTVHGTGACTYDIDYGDGDTRQVNRPLPQETQHAYTKPGTYTVAVKTHPPCQGTVSDTVGISNAVPQAPKMARVLVSPKPAIAGQPVAITIEGTGNCAYTIDYGDGNWESRSRTLPDDVRHVYARGGYYTVLAIGDAPCAGSGRATIRVARR